jgi:hypothetical protein
MLGQALGGRTMPSLLRGLVGASSCRWGAFVSLGSVQARSIWLWCVCGRCANHLDPPKRGERCALPHVLAQCCLIACMRANRGRSTASPQCDCRPFFRLSQSGSELFNRRCGPSGRWEAAAAGSRPGAKLPPRAPFRVTQRHWPRSICPGGPASGPGSWTQLAARGPCPL